MFNYFLASLVMNQRISIDEAEFVAENLQNKEPKTVSEALNLIDSTVKEYNNN